MRNDTVLVSGAASGIGRAVCLLAAERGMAVGLLDSDAEHVEAVADELRALGARAAVAVVDVTDWDALERAVSDLGRALGPAAKLVSCAGIDRGGRLPGLAQDVLRRVLEVNLVASLHLAALCIPAMTDGGSIVLVSSPAAFAAFPEATAYSAAKGGISAAVRTLAIDHAADGIRVNALVPGSTETPLMWANVPDEDVEDVRRQLRSEIPLGRLADPSEPARAALWLLSDESSYVTGSHLVCDGGLLARSAGSV
jgi:NAD(P)-dependent dehydrogenase (short-subunit alcohol dehydrogenase family)